MTPLPSHITPDRLQDDPYPLYTEMRTACPVAWAPWGEVWLVTRWEDCLRIGSDRDAFIGAERHPTINRVFGEPNVLTSADPTHRDLREAIDPRLRPRQVNTYIDALVRPIVLDRLARMRERDGAELMADFFEPISVRALGALLGLGVDDETLRRWFHGLNEGISSLELDPDALARADAITAEVERELDPLIARLTASPDDSMLSHMIHGGRGGGEPRTRDEIYPSLKVILLGGMQEPGHAAGSTLLGLLGRPDQLARVREDPSLVSVAVTEGLRWIAPIGIVERQAARDVDVGGVTIQAGDIVELVLASANRDPERYERPDEYDIDRPRLSHMAFGNGEHFCSGHYFSRQLERIALEELLPALPELRLDPAAPVVVEGWVFRAPKRLPVRWNA